jgi:hypothetical protein
MWSMWWAKWHWGKFSPSISVPIPILIPPTVPRSSSHTIRGWYSDQIVADVPSRLSLTPPQETKRKLTKLVDVGFEVLRAVNITNSIF